MKYQSLESFKKHLINAFPKHLSSLYLVVLKDPYERQKIINYIADLFLKSGSLQNHWYVYINIVQEKIA